MTDFTYATFSPRPCITIAYQRYIGGSSLPGVIFLGGFRSDMQGSKATYLNNMCQSRGQSFVRFDYTGHGLSSGRFEDGCIGSWLQDAVDVFDAQTFGPQIVVGSSMGGWLALLLTLQRQERVVGLVGIAPAPDFSEDVFHAEFTDQQRAELMNTGRTLLESGYGDPYIITRHLYEEAKNHLLLHKDIPIYCPVRLIHGQKDVEVPWKKSVKIKERLLSKDVMIEWIEDGDHRLSREQDLKTIGRAVSGF